MITKEDLAYCAGIIDGEGCLRIGRFKPSSRASVRYDARLTVNMSHRPTLEFLCDCFKEGNVRKVKEADEKHKTIWNWSLSNKKAFSIIRQLLPYLITKRAEAEVMLSFESIFSRQTFYKPVPVEITAERESLYQKIKALKKQ